MFSHQSSVPSKEGTTQLTVPSALPGPFGTMGGNLMSQFVSHIAEVLLLHVKIRSDHKGSLLNLHLCLEVYLHLASLRITG